jgi:peptidoglycan/LPS O-acetylase OafA/YrhL
MSQDEGREGAVFAALGGRKMVALLAGLVALLALAGETAAEGVSASSYEPFVWGIVGLVASFMGGNALSKFPGRPGDGRQR